MKLLRGVLLCVLFIVGVFVCSANVHTVTLVVWPDMGVDGARAQRSVELPLFVLVLGAVLMGVLLGGAGALFEQGRLRLGLRRAEKSAKRLKAEASAADANLAAECEDVERLTAELGAARREIAELRAGAAQPGQDDALGAVGAEDSERADQTAAEAVAKPADAAAGGADETEALAADDDRRPT